MKTGSPESRAEAEELNQPWERALWLVCPSASASDSDSVALMTPLATPIFDVHKVIFDVTAPLTTPIPTPLPVNPFFRPVHTRGMLLKRGTGSGERGTSIGNGKMKNWKQNLTWNLVLSATSFCSQFSSSRSPFPVPRFSNIHASQSLNRKKQAISFSDRSASWMYIILFWSDYRMVKEFVSSNTKK